jgi:hypothetical protein
MAGAAEVFHVLLPGSGLFWRRYNLLRISSFAHKSPGRDASPLLPLNLLDIREDLIYYPVSMHASRFSFAFTYRYFFTGSGEADGVLNMQK